MSPHDVHLTFEEVVIGHGHRAVAGPLSGHWGGGAVYGISGPNGCGKTTLLRTLLGLHRPLRGRIAFSEGARLSYVPQAGALDEGFPITASEVVGSGCVARGRRARTEAVEAALADVWLSHARNSAFFKLSGGQRQRVLIARALAARADVVALDEPTAGVDPEAAEKVRDTLRGLSAAGRLVLVVTHDLFSAPDLLDHLYALHPDRLEERPL